MISQVQYIVAVASGKGGVGKSTVAVNLALSMLAQGLRVGLLDADIYGPSIAMMLGVAEGQRPQSDDGKRLLPLQAQGLSTMSMAYLVTRDTPMAWRGPMASGALQQMLNHTAWGPLDVLLVDMPPGTGDIQLTLAQQVKLSGAVIVTTPQDIALLDAEKGIQMFAKVSVPILGVVENMSMHQCVACGHKEAVFGAGGGLAIAQSHEVALLGQLPLDSRVRHQGDAGVPVVVAAPDSEVAQSYMAIALAVIGALRCADTPEEPEIVFE
ncbi:MAG TPA: iron-sulfur cluster carrier protein ApbC [Porticoccaceae bacterium]|nr:iron-sulfur cluster carrier protein ApbC [Porticoccaceae bacterium]